MLIDVSYTDPRVSGFIRSFYANRVPLDQFDASARYVIAECSRCMFRWQKYILDGAGMEALYETWIDPATSLQKRVAAPASYAEGLLKEVKRIPRLFHEDAEKLRVLDFGMGWGDWAAKAHSIGLRAFGYERSPARILRAQSLGVEILSSLENASLSESFHFINCNQVLEHLAQPMEALKTIARLLAPGGVAHIAVPNADDGASEFGMSSWRAGKNAFQPLEHISAFTPAVLLHVSKRAGLSPSAWPLWKGSAGLIEPALRMVRKTDRYLYKGLIL
jgi:2-polyprenyl-3-methyl-5-hydroxy-6-metoxy-1,4-benzoquinol methylase